MKIPSPKCLRHTGLPLLWGLLLAMPAFTAPVAQTAAPSSSNASGAAPQHASVPAGADVAFALAQGETGLHALAALSGGRWARACSIATAVLAAQRADVDALGIFGVCAASANDRPAAHTALGRLREGESKPYYGALVQGVLSLRDQQPVEARQVFDAALQARQGDPLAQYFVGEAQHLARQDAEAIVSFQAVLKTWPQFAPALTAAARLIAKPGARQDQLAVARGMAERATQIEPMNTGYWSLLADLCKRTGQAERAAAITLQWLTPRAASAR